jgi:hypothetical protein
MTQSLNRQIKRGHAKVKKVKVFTQPTWYYDPILGFQWRTNTSYIYVVEKY